MVIDELLEELILRDGSDLHLKVAEKPILRIGGKLVRCDRSEITSETIGQIIEEIITNQQMEKLILERELDLSYKLQDRARFRINIFFQKGFLGMVLRLIPKEIPTIDELGLPGVIKEMIARKEGMILVTGPTGSGKSTTLAAMVNEINRTQPYHIITIEDPIEFVHKDNNQSLINQREIGSDTKSFSEALRRAMRQDPDIILVGEMRDSETISIAITAAETGHLVLSTLHTNDAKQTIDRILDTFPPEQQYQIRMQLANILIGIISQRLIPRKNGHGRAAAMEIMLNSPTIKKLIEDNRTGAITKTMEESTSYYSMQSFNQSLFKLWKEEVISEQDALATSTNPSDLELKMKTASFGVSQGKIKTVK